MTVIRELELQLTDWEAKYVLEALSKEMTRLKIINQTSEDEDEAADAGNDYIELSGFFDKVSSKAKSTFGEQILTFSNEQL